MDPQYIINVLAGTLDASKATREAAEAALKQIWQTQGCTTAILSILAANVDKRYRQSMGVNLKNNIRMLCRTIGNDEKVQFRGTLLKMLFVETDSSVRDIFGESLRVLAEIDLPDVRGMANNWPDLIPNIMAAMSSNDLLQIFNSLFLFRKIIKNLQFKRSSERGALDDLIAQSFPVIQGRLRQCIAMNQPEVAHILRLSLKIFHSSVVFSLPEGVQGNITHPVVDFQLWFEVMNALLAKRLPEGSEGVEPTGQPTDPDDRNQWVWWKVKKWASRTILHFQARYVLHTEDKYRSISQTFISTYTDGFLKTAMSLLHEKSKGQYLSNEVFRNCVVYVTNCVEISSSFKSLVKDHIDFLVFQVVFPTLLLNQSDLDAMKEEPATFIRSMDCQPEDWIDPRSSCVTLLQTLASTRQKYALPVILARVQQILTDYSNSDVQSKNYYHKDGAISIISLLFTTFKKSKSYKHLVEPFVLSNVVPELQSPVPFLRFRACWSIEQFPKNSIKTAGQPTVIVQALVTLLRSDPEVATRAKAAVAIQRMLKYQEVKDCLRPHIKLLVQEYFKIMQEVENDNVLSALQSLVFTYKENMAEIAIDMVGSLAQMFVGYFNDANRATSEDQDYAAMYECECLQTIQHVISCVYKRPEVLVSLEQFVCPLSSVILESIVKGGQSGQDGLEDNSSKSLEYLDNVCDMLFILSNHSKALSPSLWQCCQLLMKTGLDTNGGFDYLSDIVPIVLNFMRRDMHTFLRMEGNVTTFFEVVKKLVTYDDYHEGTYEMEWNLSLLLLTAFVVECKPFPQIQYIISDPNNPLANIAHILTKTPKIAQYQEEITTEIKQYMESAHGLGALGPTIVQTYFKAILDMIFPFIQDARHPARQKHDGSVQAAFPTKSSTKTRCMELILSMLYFDAEKTLQLLMATPGWLDLAFNYLFANFQNMSHVSTERMIVLGLSNVVTCVARNPAAYPASLSGNLVTMIRHIIKENVYLAEAEAEEPEYSDDDPDDDGEEDFEGFQDEGVDENADVTDPALQDYFERLGEVQANQVNDALGEPVDDEDEDLGGDSYPAGVERIDPVVYFTDQLSTLPPDVAQPIMAALQQDPDANLPDSALSQFTKLNASTADRKYGILSRFIYK